MEAFSATNLSEVAADSVSLWSAASRSWVDVRDVFVEKTQVTSPVSVQIPVADEIDVVLQYPNPNSHQVNSEGRASQTNNFCLLYTSPSPRD